VSILDSIKGERVMGFGHWRYRLLHWCFNVKNPDPKNPYETGLPKFLYTHYCPLFHLTNLIAILSPVILGVKVFVAVVAAFFGALAAIPWAAIAERVFKVIDWVAKRLPERKAVEEGPAVPERPRVRTKGEERQFLINVLCDSGWDTFPPFEAYWSHNCYHFQAMTQPEVQAVYDEWVARINAARLKRKERKDRLRQRLIFWTNFSRVFVKWAMNVLYIGLALLVAYGVYHLAGPVLDFVSWVLGGLWWGLTESNFWGSVWWVVKYGGMLAILSVFVGGLMYGLLKIGFIERFAVLLCRGLGTALMPAGFAWHLLCRLFRWFGKGVVGVGEFVSMFYEENCPPIKLVSNEEAQLAAIENDDQ
jgi:hypothetical protein